MRVFAVVGALLVCFETLPAPARAEELDSREGSQGGSAEPPEGDGGRGRKAIFETPYLCRLGKRYPLVATQLDPPNALSSVPSRCLVPLRLAALSL